MFSVGDAILIIAFVFILTMCDRYRRRYITILSQKKSSEVRLGQIAEHLVPVLRYFKYDPKKAHFLGMPVDYIIFENDKIVFLEVKTGRSSLSRTQRDIKKLITEGKVVWEEIRLTPEVVTLEDRENTIKTLQKSGLELKV